jgi:hypothetical protein
MATVTSQSKRQFATGVKVDVSGGALVVKPRGASVDTSSVPRTRSNAAKSPDRLAAVVEALPPENRKLLVWAMDRLNTASTPAQMSAAKHALREALIVRTKEQATRSIRAKVA